MEENELIQRCIIILIAIFAIIAILVIMIFDTPKNKDDVEEIAISENKVETPIEKRNIVKVEEKEKSSKGVPSLENALKEYDAVDIVVLDDRIISSTSGNRASVIYYFDENSLVKELETRMVFGDKETAMYYISNLSNEEYEGYEREVERNGSEVVIKVYISEEHRDLSKSKMIENVEKEKETQNVNIKYE